MDKVCQFRQALKFSNETPDACCASGKCLLLPITTLLELLQSLLDGKSNDLKFTQDTNIYFLLPNYIIWGNQNLRSHIRRTSFRYHKIGSLKLVPIDDPKFL